MANYIDKYQMKAKGLDLERNEPQNAIKYYNDLLTHEYFINDFWPYRRLVLMYKKTKELNKKTKIIKIFFKSSIYCNNHQFLWFRNKLRALSEKDYITPEEINSLEDYFKTHSIINKNKANIPLPIADRIRKQKGEIIVVNEEEYENKQKQYEYEVKCTELNRQKRYVEYIDLLNHMIDELGYNRYSYFQKLCVAYRRFNDYDNELRVINKYRNGESTQTKISDKWFEKRLKELKYLSNEEITVNNSSDILYRNKKLKKEIKPLKNQLRKYNNHNHNYKIFNHFTGEFKENLPQKEISKALGTEDEYIYTITINPNFEFDLTQKPSFEYDNKLEDIENIIRKILLKEYGRQLVYDKEFDEAILFFNELKNNSYFKNDWYPYRQLTIIYDRTKNYQANLENIKNILLSGIYLNDYQYIWFTNKIKNIQKEIPIDSEQVEEWIDFYQSNGANNKSQLNKMLADRITKKENEYKILSQDSFNVRQNIYEIDEIGRIYEREKDYELAIIHYEDVIADPPKEFNQNTIEKYEKQLKKIRKKL